MFSNTFSTLSTKVKNMSEVDSTSEINNHSRTAENIAYFALHLGHKLIKPQTVVRDHQDFYVACDDLTKTWYMCMRYVMMIDIDFKDHTDTENIIPRLQASEHLFDVYKTGKGYHAFCLSKRFDYTSTDTHRLMLDLGCDYFYVVWISLRGWCVRVNMKRKEMMDRLCSSNTNDLCAPIYSYIGRFGNTTIPIDLEIQSIVRKHIRYSKTYMNYPVAKC